MTDKKKYHKKFHCTRITQVQLSSPYLEVGPGTTEDVLSSRMPLYDADPPLVASQVQQPLGQVGQKALVRDTLQLHRPVFATRGTHVIERVLFHVQHRATVAAHLQHKTRRLSLDSLDITIFTLVEFLR